MAARVGRGRPECHRVSGARPMPLTPVWNCGTDREIPPLQYADNSVCSLSESGNALPGILPRSSWWLGPNQILVFFKLIWTRSRSYRTGAYPGGSRRKPGRPWLVLVVSELCGRGYGARRTRDRSTRGEERFVGRSMAGATVGVAKRQQVNFLPQNRKGRPPAS